MSEDLRKLGYRGTQVLLFVRQAIRKTGDVPSYTEIRDGLGFNDRAEVCRVVQRLEHRGLIYRTGNGRVRRIRLAG